jgi:rod shape-determining protein MreC
MSYLLDKKIKQKRFLQTALSIVFLAVLFFYRSPVFGGLSAVTQVIFHPFLVVGGSMGEKFGNIGSYFASKNSLYAQNKKLQTEVEFDDARMANYDSVLADDAGIKEILGRKDPKAPMILSAILSKPNQSSYDTLIIDAGTEQNVKTGNRVFALGNIPVGRVAEVYPNSAKVVLFSNPGEKTEVVISGKNIFMELIGRGGGNFEMIMPRDLTLQKGDQVVMPGISPSLVAIAETIISDPRDPFNKALLSSPVNIQNLKFVEVAQ